MVTTMDDDGEHGARIPDWMTAETFVVETARAAERLVVLPVGDIDERALVALEHIRTIPAREKRALHVVTNDRRAHARMGVEEALPP
jgi:hypothetical protein